MLACPPPLIDLYGPAGGITFSLVSAMDECVDTITIVVANINADVFICLPYLVFCYSVSRLGLRRIPRRFFFVDDFLLLVEALVFLAVTGAAFFFGADFFRGGDFLCATDCVTLACLIFLS